MDFLAYNYKAILKGWQLFDLLKSIRSIEFTIVSGFKSNISGRECNSKLNSNININSSMESID